MVRKVMLEKPWPPVALWRALKKSPHGNINIPQKQ